MIIRFSCLQWLLLSSAAIGTTNAFVTPSNGNTKNIINVLSASTDTPTTPATDSSTTEGESSHSGLTQDIVSRLRWRELQQALESRDLPIEGTTEILRDRLKEVAVDFVAATEDSDDDCIVDMDDIDITFTDLSDPKFEYKDLVRQVVEKSERLHWKSGVRKMRRLHKLVKNSSDESLCIPPGVYDSLLRACAEDRLHGARAAESARKIMELMVEEGYTIPTDLINNCIFNTIGEGSGSGADATKHDGHGGIDTALAMLSAVNEQEERTNQNVVTMSSYDALLNGLAREGGSAVDDALKLLRSVIVEKSDTPLLSSFAYVARAEILNGEKWDKKKNKKNKENKKAGLSEDSVDINAKKEGEESEVGPEKVFNVLAYVKAAGYELNNIASTEDGRALLAAGIIAADRVASAGVGLRLLKSASEAAGCAPERGDILVANSSPAVRKACIRAHVRGINTAIEDGKWQLAVKVLELMLERKFNPSSRVWTNVITCCAKNKKSKKATAILMDWTKLHKSGVMLDAPPLATFNTVINACEVCKEEELTQRVLDLMNETQKTAGNIITFNIALKRLAKLGNFWAAEGIVIGMIESGIEPTVVSYTTAIASCAASETKQPAKAYEWLQRMRLMGTRPNVITYNTALGACLDGKIESLQIASTIAKEMLEQVGAQLVVDDEDQKNIGSKRVRNEYTDVIPDYYTRQRSRELMRQLKDQWVSGAIDKDLAISTIRVPLLNLSQFSSIKAIEEAKEKRAEQALVTKKSAALEDVEATDDAELELEYSGAAHRIAEV